MNTVQKLLAVLPGRWFGDAAKVSGGVLYAVLTAFAKGLDYIEEAAAYVVLQTRLGTATGDNLDKIAADFFGVRFPRRGGEADDSFRVRIKKELFRAKATRAGVVSAVEDLGAEVVEIYEPFVDGFFTDYGRSDQHRASDMHPYTAILFISRPLSPGRTNLLFSDYNYLDHNFAVDDAYSVWAVSDDEVFEVIEAAKAYGTEIFAVFDPVPLSATTGDNFSSAARYYVPSITAAALPAGRFDDTLRFDEAEEVFA